MGISISEAGLTLCCIRQELQVSNTQQTVMSSIFPPAQEVLGVNLGLAIGGGMQAPKHGVSLQQALQRYLQLQCASTL